MRDMGFMVPDILHLLIPWFELKDMGRRRGVLMGELMMDGLFLGLNQPVPPNYYTNTIKINNLQQLPIVLCTF